MSQLHFVATEEYRQRVIQLGEQPTSVFTVGGLGFDSINNLKLLSRRDLECALDFKFQKRNLIVTYHPVTADKKSCITGMEDLLSALSFLYHIIFTMPNCDTDGRVLLEMVDNFCLSSPLSRLSSLGRLVSSCLQYVDAVVGNFPVAFLKLLIFNWYY